MPRGSLRLAALALAAVALHAAPARADHYTIDPDHSSVYFKVKHLDLAWVYGRFDQFSGSFTVDAKDVTKSSFTLNITTESVNTNQAKRDAHLKSGDFFDVKKFPTIEFKSTAVKQIPGGLQVTGDFTLRGVTKSITFRMLGGKAAEFPKGVHRTGYSTEHTLMRTDYGMNFMVGPVGDEVVIMIGMEGVRKKE